MERKEAIEWLTKIENKLPYYNGSEHLALAMAKESLKNNTFKNKYNLGDVVLFEKWDYRTGQIFGLEGTITGILFNDINEIQYDIQYKLNGDYEDCTVIEDAIKSKKDFFIESNIDRLKPCPFCGRQASFRTTLDNGFIYVVCANDGCYARTDGCLNEEEAIKCWNRRVIVDDTK